ncbi:MAG: hypothetical protein QGI55_11290, partial [Pseudomonadales bacterium]|nr:hypothetical protein [Pseudomonadales bacterium]
MNTTKSGPPFRAEHIGSLLRPKTLTQAYTHHVAGELTDEEFRAIQDHAIQEVVVLQESTGLKMVGDGEFRRSSYWAHWVEAIEGLDIAEALFRFHDADGNQQAFMAATCIDTLRKTAAISTGEFEFLEHNTDVTIKITMPSPSTLHFWRQGKTIEASPYASDEAYMNDLCAIYRQEIADLAALGCSYVQLDEVPLIMLANNRIRTQVRTFGRDPEKLMDLYIQSINEVVSARPA